MFCSKKGQATIFILISIVLLIAGGVFYYITQIKGIETKADSRISEIISAEFKPISDYITSCLYKTSEEAVIKIGETGGYVSINDLELNGKANIGDAVVSVTPSGQHKAVYWRYFNGAEFVSKMPPLRKKDDKAKEQQSIESQIGKYAEKEIDKCLNNFQPFSDKGFVFDLKGKKKAEAAVTETDISVELQFPLEVTKQSSKVELKKFAAKIPVNLKKIYELANQITELENTQKFFEEYTNTILFLNSGDAPRPPPKYELFFSYSPKFYVRSHVESKIKPIIEQQFSAFQLVKQGSNVQNPFPDGVLITIPSASSNLLDGTDVSFRASPANWPFKFDICGKEICRSTSCTGPIPIAPCQILRSSYNIRFPILVEITQPNALNQQPYRFRFFLDSVVKNNVPLEAGTQPITAKNIPYSSQLCDISTWNSGDVAIKVLNETTGNGIADAQVYFSGTRESCIVGVTDKDGKVVTKLPTGTAFATLSASSLDTIGNYIEFDAEPDIKQNADINLQPLFQKKFSVKKKKFSKDILSNSWKIDTTPLELDQNEKATITLTKIQKGNQESYSTLVEFIGQLPPEVYPNISIADGEYEADIQLMVNDIVKIPASVKEEGGFLGMGKTKIEIPEINFAVPPESNIHIAKLESLQPLSYQYKIRCIDKSKNVDENDPKPEYKSITAAINVQPVQTQSLSIKSITPSQFNSERGYIAVETTAQSECRFFDKTINPDKTIPPNEKKGDKFGYELYDSFDTSGLVHIKILDFKKSQHKFDVICKDKSDANSQWILKEDIEVKVIPSYGFKASSSDIDFNGDSKIDIQKPTEELQISTISPVNQFDTTEALIAVETNHYTSCSYAEINPNSDAPSDGSYKPMGIAINKEFIEGGLKGKIKIDSVENKDEIIFYVLDMGLDDLPQEKRTIEDLEHLNNVEQESQDWTGSLQPEYK